MDKNPLINLKSFGDRASPNCVILFPQSYSEILTEAKILVSFNWEIQPNAVISISVRLISSHLRVIMMDIQFRTATDETCQRPPPFLLSALLHSRRILRGRGVINGDKRLHLPSISGLPFKLMEGERGGDAVS